jgi:hypothetical protein
MSAATLQLVHDPLEVTTFAGADWSEPPVVEDQHVGLGELREQARVAPVGVGQRELVEESRHAAVQDAVFLRTEWVAALR